MRCKTLQRFTDLKENKVRELGDEFELTKERFEQLENANLVQEVKAVKKPTKK